MIPEEYYKKKLKVELTAQEIESIIDELGRIPHNIFDFMKYDKLIAKLRKPLNQTSKG